MAENAIVGGHQRETYYVNEGIHNQRNQAVNQVGYRQGQRALSMSPSH
jgi:hypothetical protein